jgi:tRNA/tmRNA/rRNA uracil-C5-methylase (TrmA/RlmC/RlmD family)
MHRLTRSGQVQPGWGLEAVTMALAVPLEVPVGSFFQVNRHLVPALFDRVGELVGTEALPTWDLHAGVGFLAAAVRAARGRGDEATPLTLVEPYRSAARAARRNLPDAEVAVGRTAEAYLDRHRGLPRRALVLTDPPRSGLEPPLRAALARWKPLRLLMLSCDPATWARDTGFLLGHGFTLAHLELMDLFPSTHHVEVLAVLEAP